MLAAIHVGLRTAFEELLDPGCVFVGLLDGFEKFAAEFLHVVLLERFLAVPLETSKQTYGVAWFGFGLKVDE